MIDRRQVMRRAHAIAVTLTGAYSARISAALKQAWAEARAPDMLTIGYEKSKIEDFLQTISALNVHTLIDVRDFPGSRMKGFSKTRLAEALATIGVEYVHLRNLGDPKPGREAARRGDYAAFEQIFSAHMQTDAAQRDLERACDLSKTRKCCLLCFERDHKVCHRNIVADHITAATGVRVCHVNVHQGAKGESRDSCEGAASTRPKTRRNSVLRGSDRGRKVATPVSH